MVREEVQAGEQRRLTLGHALAVAFGGEVPSRSGYLIGGVARMLDHQISLLNIMLHTTMLRNFMPTWLKRVRLRLQIVACLQPR